MSDCGQRKADTAVDPVPARNLKKSVLERIELAFFVELSLKPSNVALVAVVAAGLVKDLHEYAQQGVSLILTYQICLLINVEQQTLRWNAISLIQ